MAISVESILADARKLVLRLKEHDNSADCLTVRTQSLQKQLVAMKQVRMYIIQSSWPLSWKTWNSQGIPNWSGKSQGKWKKSEKSQGNS